MGGSLGLPIHLGHGPVDVLLPNSFGHELFELAKVRVLGLEQRTEKLILSSNFLRLVRHAGRRTAAACRPTVGQRGAVALAGLPRRAFGTDGERRFAAPPDPWLSRPVPG